MNKTIKTRKEKWFKVNKGMIILPIIILTLIMMIGITKPFSTSGTDYSSTVTIISSGGTTVSGIDYSTQTAISQTAVGTISSTNYITYLGFFHGAVRAPANNPPTIILLTPTSGNTSIQDLTPEFTWDGNDADNDPLNYTIWVDNDSNFISPLIQATTNAENYTSTTELQIDTLYYWKVQVYDQTVYVNSSTWNFTTESYAAITLVNDTVDFGQLNISGTNNTTDNNPYPLVIRNIGNINVNLTIYANDSLWQSPTGILNTSYFRFKADNRTEPGSFDYANSQTSWRNMTSYNISLIKLLNYSDSKDEAEVDLEITVPADEPTGLKNSTIIIQTE